jgi:uncharacterized protein (DUF2236 family)
MRECHPRFAPGTPYSAHDPDLLTWVHLALHATLLRAYAAVVGWSSEADQDRYCRAVACIEPLLGIPEGRLPRDATTLRSEFRARLPELSVGENALRIAHGILHPPLPYWVAPLSRFARLWTIGLLPGSVRARYGLRWEPQHAVLFAASVRLTRGLLPRIPAGLRYVPPEWMLRWRDTGRVPQHSLVRYPT